MAVIRYGVRTRSGSWYLLEDHTHLFSHPTWKLVCEKGVFDVLFLAAPPRGNPLIPADKIRSDRDFLEKMIYYADGADYESGDFRAPHTSPVFEVVRFA